MNGHSCKIKTSDREKQAYAGLKVTDIAAKFPGHLLVPVTSNVEGFHDSGSALPWNILVKQKHLGVHKSTINEVSGQILAKGQWNEGDAVVADLVVHTVFRGNDLVLAPRDEDKHSPLAESGSSARVSLVANSNGDPEVLKWCSHNGIDGNGRPWLERQLHFFAKSQAVKDTDMFVRPSRHSLTAEGAEIVFPYVPSHTLAEVALAGVGSEALLEVVDDLLGEMAIVLWPHSAIPCPANFIEQAHFSRIQRRIGIARKDVPELDELVNLDSITFNGTQIMGFRQVIAALSSHPTIKAIVPMELGEIHGDLNLHNILCVLYPDARRKVMLIDPRGVPLLSEYSAPDAFEPGDYAYDISKLKFSLSAFSEIRKGLSSMAEAEKHSYRFDLVDHPGSATFRGADRDFFTKLQSNKDFLNWVNRVEPHGFHSLQLRVMLGEAAHFVADAACALGRNTPHEVVPLFVYGLYKLNNVLACLEKSAGTLSASLTTTKLSARNGSYGVHAMQTSLLETWDSSWPWDVLEILACDQSIHEVEKHVWDLIGEYLPERVQIYTAENLPAALTCPCVFIRPCSNFPERLRDAHSGISETSAILEQHFPSRVFEDLRIVTLFTRSTTTPDQHLTNDLLRPGVWGISPLKLALLQANQLTFSCGGRWLLDANTFFIVKWDNDSVDDINESLNLNGESPKPEGENDYISLPLFIPSSLSQKPVNNALTRTNSTLAYPDNFAKIYHFGTQDSYNDMLENIPNDPLLKSLAFLPSSAKWWRCYKAWKMTKDEDKDKQG